jgi:8-oxo-dGTP pyrophosphatase MutT (NUDIX family)
MEPRPEPARPPGWLPKAEFDSIFSRVPRLCVEVVIAAPERGVLLTRRDIPPNAGAWHIAGGTVLFGEPLVQSVKRVARDELGLEVAVGELLGYIEYPSHYNNGLTRRSDSRLTPRWSRATRTRRTYRRVANGSAACPPVCTRSSATF